jgi:general secretion pathway protein D
VAVLVAVACCLGAPTLPAQENGAVLVDFSFDQVELRLLARLVGEMTGRRFVVEEGVSGRVTIVTPQQIRADEALPLFLSVLESSGYSVLDKNGVLHVVALPEEVTPVAPVVGTQGVSLPDGIVTKILKLDHISALEVRKALEAMVRGADKGALTAVPSSNHLIVTDTAGSIRRIEQIVAELDRQGASRLTEVVQLKHAGAAEVARQVMLAMKGAESAGSALSRQMRQVTTGEAVLPTGMTVVAAEQANSVIVVGTPVQLAEAKRVIELMDVAPSSGTGRLNHIFLKYLTASEISTNLNALLAKTLAKDEERKIAIEPNASNNALLIDASPRDFELVRNLVEDLDIAPQKVMVEILIAEVAEGENLDFGVDWSTIDLPEQGSTTFIGRSRPGESDVIQNLINEAVTPQGLAVGVARGTFENADGTVVPRIPVLVTALAQERDITIHANVPLLAQNNREASVSVVENIPILTSVIEGGAGTARDVIQNIERIDVGIELKFTPHINPDREILMDLNPSIEAIIDEGTEDQPFTPTIARREVNTTVTVPDLATVVISGLIREDVITEVSKVPILGDVPVLGYLFRRNVDRKSRTNLMIMVTPHIIDDLETAGEMRDHLDALAASDELAGALGFGTPDEE